MTLSFRTPLWLPLLHTPRRYELFIVNVNWDVLSHRLQSTSPLGPKHVGKNKVDGIDNDTRKRKHRFLLLHLSVLKEEVLLKTSKVSDSLYRNQQWSSFVTLTWVSDVVINRSNGHPHITLTLIKFKLVYSVSLSVEGGRSPPSQKTSRVSSMTRGRRTYWGLLLIKVSVISPNTFLFTKIVVLI